MTDPILIVGAGPTGLTACARVVASRDPRPPHRQTDGGRHHLSGGWDSGAVPSNRSSSGASPRRWYASAIVPRLAACTATAVAYSAWTLAAWRAATTSCSSSRRRRPNASCVRLSDAARRRRRVRGVELVALSQDALSQAPSPVKAVLRHSDGRLSGGKSGVSLGEIRCQFIFSGNPVSVHHFRGKSGVSSSFWKKSGPGRPGWLPTQAPHRSGLAHHAHPVPHLMNSRPRDPSSLRGHGSGHDVPGMFPFNGS